MHHSARQVVRAQARQDRQRHGWADATDTQQNPEQVPVLAPWEAEQRLVVLAHRKVREDLGAGPFGGKGGPEGRDQFVTDTAGIDDDGGSGPIGDFAGDELKHGCVD